MAKSNAKKNRERLVKQGKLDPSVLRGSWHGVNHQMKVIPNKKKNVKPLDYDYNRAYNLLA
ncbi:hypothetical protein M3194_20875 [Paenibacillus glycanilyticus]|uniref:hypothetical protein n=1 Tax=Paenibacillus glycanilyticus TaxID=126569 RepID=UPI00203D4A15|nr:hypothetical protein [Paenibacillus glycanilyticus]MCM3629797.1 hypothetical protein [Paenibacillus glycanilyticus]